MKLEKENEPHTKHVAMNGAHPDGGGGSLCPKLEQIMARGFPTYQTLWTMVVVLCLGCAVQSHDEF